MKGKSKGGKIKVMKASKSKKGTKKTLTVGKKNNNLAYAF